jgi:DNA-binding transcriptional LysR family regulator
MQTVDRRQLACFVAVVDAGGLRAAAERRHVAPPTSSTALGMRERVSGAVPPAYAA